MKRILAPVPILLMSIAMLLSTVLLVGLGHDHLVPVVTATFGPVLAAMLTGYLQQLRADVMEVKHQTNALKDELVAATDRSARAEGRIEGRGERGDHKQE